MKAPALVFCLGLLLSDIAQADSLNVRSVGHCAAGRRADGMAIVGTHVIVADKGLRVISVADPAHPVEVAYWESSGGAGGAHDVVVRGEYAYVADNIFGLWIVSIADMRHPVQVGYWDAGGGAMGVAVSDGFAYLAETDSCLSVFSVADPTHPVRVGNWHNTYGFAFDVAVEGDYAYVARNTSGLDVISVADPAQPALVGSFKTPDQLVALTLRGHYVYAADVTAGLRVISVADPTVPFEVGYCDTPGRALGVAVHGNYAYVADSALRVISIADPAHPVEVGFYDTPTRAYDVAVGRGLIFVTYEYGFGVFQFYGPGDLDVDNDSLDVVADTIRLRGSGSYACGEFVLANTSVSYNPDSIDGPSVSVVDSLSYTGSLVGPGGMLDSILIPSLPMSLAQGQAIICTLAVYLPPGLRSGDYAGTVTITGKDSAGLLVEETFHALVRKLGDLDVDNDSLDVIADTIRARPRLVSAGPPLEYTEYALGEFVIANTSTSYNPDTSDGPSQSPVDSLSYVASLVGPGGTIDSIVIPNLPASLAQGQMAPCTLAVFVPAALPAGDYSGPITISGRDSLGFLTDETFYALVTKLGDLDVDGDSLDVASDTMNLSTLPAGPVYSPYAKAEFMLVNTSDSYNPDAEDGPSRSPLRAVKVEARVTTGDSSRAGTVPCSVYVFNLPGSLAVGQAVECTLALVIPVGESLNDYFGLVTIDAYDTLGYAVRDSFFLTVRGPQPRQSLDSLRVAPIPFKPNQNPEHDAIHFQGLTAGARVVVYDASGQSVWSATEAGDGHLKWDAKVASGIYVYLVVAKDGQSRVGKLSVIR
jgi:hypothetical protein